MEGSGIRVVLYSAANRTSPKENFLSRVIVKKSVSLQHNVARAVLVDVAKVRHGSQIEPFTSTEITYVSSYNYELLMNNVL